MKTATTTITRSPYNPSKLAGNVLCRRCCVMDDPRRLVIEITRTPDGRWLATRVVHADDPCPVLPLHSGQPLGPGARHRRYERGPKRLG